MVNDVENFNFTIHYKPMIKNTVVNSLSWYPSVDKGNFDDYTQVCTIDEVKETFDGAVNQRNDDKTWTLIVNKIFTNISEVESQLQNVAGEKLMVLSHKNIFDGQMKES